MQSGQVPVWVPIIVGIIGVVGVLVGQLLSMWREQRNEIVRAQIERANEDRKNRRDDRLYWRDRRIEVGAEFLVSLNVWRELTVDEWHEIAKDGQIGQQTREQLGETVTRVSDQLAHIRLIGTDAMSTTAASAVSTLLRVTRDTKRGLERQDHQMDLTSASDSLTAEIRRVREVFRAELGVPAANLAAATSAT